jgi:hypothetical protein
MEGVVMRFLLAVAIALASCLATSAAMAADPDQAKPDQVTPDQAKPDQAKPDQAMPDQAKPDQVKPDQVKPDQVACGGSCQPRKSRLALRLRK